MMKRFLTLLIGIASAALFASETLHLDFTGPKELMLGGSSQKIQGTFADGQYLKVGKNSVVLPGGALVGNNQGTILFGFKLEPQQPPLNIQRTLLHLRTASRLTIGWNLYGGGEFQFSFSDRSMTFNKNFGKLKIGQDYQAGVTWDGKVVRLYMDGRMVAEGKQPLAVKAQVRNLNIGPYKDGWLAPKPWADDTLVKYLYVYNTALTPAEVAKLTNVSFTPLAKSNPAQLVVPPVPSGKTSPVIDGKLNETAWSYAASMPRLIYGNFPVKSGTLPPHKFMMTYDKENLYLGFNTLFPGRTPLQEGALRTADKEPEAWGTESFEFYLRFGGHTYRFAGNVAGGYTEWRDSDAKWQTPWKYAVSKEMKIDDSILWQGEVAIPWKSIGLNGVPKDPIQFNFCRTWRLPQIGGASSLSLHPTYAHEGDLLPVRFAPAPVVQLNKHNDPAGGEYVQEFSIASANKAKVEYTVALAKLDGSVAPMALHTQKCTLKPGEIFTDRSATKIATPGYDCLLYTATANGKVFMQEVVPFKLNEEYFVVTPLLLQGKINVELKPGLIKGKFGSDFKGQLVLADQRGKTLSSFAADGEQVTVPFDRANAAGLYTLELRGVDGKVIYKKELNYPGRGEWETMDFHKEWIVPPYTAMNARAENNLLTANVVGRTYSWKKSLLPSQITSGGEALFAAPAALLIDGRAVAAGSFKTTLNKPHRIEFKATGADNGTKVDFNSWLEYDGVQWNKVTVIPASGAKTLELRFELPAQFAKYLHAVSSTNSWGSKITRAVPEGTLNLGFHVMVWLGNEEKGFCFFTESRHNWTAPSNRSYTIEKKNGKAVLLVRIADKLTAGKPLTLEFGTLASPVKPLEVNYPFNTLGWSYSAPMNRPGRRPTSDVVYINAQGGGDLGHFFGDIDVPGGHATARAIRRCLDQVCAGNNVRPMPYTCSRHLSIKYPETAAFITEWTLKPEIAMDYTHTGHFVYDCCPTTSASAFFAYRTLKMLQRNPDMKGVYFDFGTVSECSNTFHGCNQRVPLLGLREFYRRIAVVQMMAGIKNPVIVAHNTDHVSLPSFTFVTHLLNGENVRQASSPLLHNKKVLTESYDLAMFACELSTLPFGITNSDYLPVDNLMAKYGGGDETDHAYKFRQGKAMFAAMLPHNTIPCLWRNHHGLFDKLIRIYDRFGVDKAKFVGYWKMPVKVLQGKDILASCYVSPDGKKVLAVIGHAGKTKVDQQLKLELDPAKLGVTGKLNKAVDTMTAPDPDYQWLFEQQKAKRVPPVRAPIKLDGCDFGSKVTGFDGKTLQLELKHHSFAIVELMP